MTRHHFMITTALALAAGAVPQMAQASCSGSACNALSATAAWSSSDKKVNAVLTNKEAKEMQVKFCVTVDSRCNPFELTLPARGSVTKSVSVSGGAAPPKFAVDVTKADFAAVQGASTSSGSSTTTGVATATSGMDVARFGRFTYAASAESTVAPALKKAISTLSTAEDLETQLMQHDSDLAEITNKLESIKKIEADVSQNMEKSKQSTRIAQVSDTGFKLVARALEQMQDDAKEAADNFAISKDDLTEVQNRQRAGDLMAEAEKSRQGLSRFLGFVSFAMDSAKKVAEGPEGSAMVAVDATLKVVELLASNPWEEEARKLTAEADKIQAGNAVKKLKLASDHLKKAQARLPGLKSDLQEAKATNDKAWRDAKGTFDTTTKGRFQWKNLDAAIPQAQSVIDLARKTTEAAYAARSAATAVEGTAGGSNWSNPGDDQRIVTAMHDKANGIFDRAIKKRQIVELLMKKLQEATATAKQAQGG
jgi:hypothetical protein